jgi:hypothetical protein
MDKIHLQSGGAAHAEHAVEVPQPSRIVASDGAPPRVLKFSTIVAALAALAMAASIVMEHVTH